MILYILDDEHNPIKVNNLLGLINWFWIAAKNDSEGKGKKPTLRVALTELRDGRRVSTIFSALDYNCGSGKPLLFETKVYKKDSDPKRQLIERYSTWDEAKKGHKRIVKKLRDEGGDNK